MALDNFYIVLPSNTFNPLSPNQSNKFRIQLPRKLFFDGPGWVVGLASLIYPNSWATLGTHEQQYVIVHTQNGERHRFVVPKGSYVSPEEMEKGIHVGMVRLLEEKLALPPKALKRRRREAPQEEVPEFPLAWEKLKIAQRNWLMELRRSLGRPSTSPHLSTEEKVLLGNLQEISRQGVNDAEIRELARYRSERGETQKQIDKSRLDWSDLYFVHQYRRRLREAALAKAQQQKQQKETTSKPDPPPTTPTPPKSEPPPRQERVVAAQEQSILGDERYSDYPWAEDVEQWGEEKRLELLKMEPLPRLRLLRERDYFLFQKALHAFNLRHRVTPAWNNPRFWGFLQQNVEEFEELYSAASFQDNYANMSEGEKTELLDVAKSLRFVWDPSLQRFTLKVYGGAAEQTVHHVALTGQLAEMLGYLASGPIYPGSQAKYAPNLSGGITHLVLYMNNGLIEEMVMGDRSVPVLQVVAVEGKPGALVQRDFLPPMYHSVKCKEADVIDVEIRTLAGNLLPFEYGNVILTLHFKRSLTFVS